MNEAVLDAVDLSKLLHRSPATIRADISRRPWTLPPAIRLGARTLWLLSTVIEWLKARERPLDQKKPEPFYAAEIRRKRGRPTKAEQVAKAMSLNTNLDNN